jgi:hypothetical protein
MKHEWTKYKRKICCRVLIWLLEMATSQHTKLTAVSHQAEGKFLNETEITVKFVHVLLQDTALKPSLIHVLFIQGMKIFLSYEIMDLKTKV